VIGNDALIALELVPRDVAFMLLLEQDVPFLSRATQPAPHALAAFLDDGLARCAAESISAGIDRVGQGPFRSARVRSSHSRRRPRGTAHPCELFASTLLVNAGGTATAPIRSSCLSCRAADGHWDGEDRRFRPRRR